MHLNASSEGAGALEENDAQQGNWKIIKHRNDFSP